MKKAFVVLMALLAVGAFSSAASAGKNVNGTAWLSFSSDYTAPVTNLDVMPVRTQYVYIQLGNVVELNGCQFEIRWLPCGGPSSGCYEFMTGSYESGTGTDCTWLMRGNQLAVEDHGVLPSGVCYWRVAVASDCNTLCTTGNVARMQLDFGKCMPNTPGRFCLSYVNVVDCNIVQDGLTVTGGATILGGEGVESPCGPTTSTEPTTWGSIKALYR